MRSCQGMPFAIQSFPLCICHIHGGTPGSLGLPAPSLAVLCRRWTDLDDCWSAALLNDCLLVLLLLLFSALLLFELGQQRGDWPSPTGLFSAEWACVVIRLHCVAVW